jgi:hypothetical protein
MPRRGRPFTKFCGVRKRHYRAEAETQEGWWFTEEVAVRSNCRVSFKDRATREETL